MEKKKIISTFSILTLIAACGGGGGGSMTDDAPQGPVSGAEVASVFGSITDIAGDGLIGDLTTMDPELLDPTLDEITPIDVTAGGSASYDGIILISDVNTSTILDPMADLETGADDLFDSEPTFAVLGRSNMDVTFGANPSISGGADGFIGMNADDILALDEADVPENPTEAEVIAFIDSLPTVDVDGSLTYSNASVLDLSDLGIEELPNGMAFDVDGNLVLTSDLTGLDSTQNVTIDGNGVAVFTNVLAGGLVDLGTTGGTADLPLGGLIIGVAE